MVFVRLFMDSDIIFWPKKPCKKNLADFLNPPHALILIFPDFGLGGAGDGVGCRKGEFHPGDSSILRTKFCHLFSAKSTARQRDS